MNIGDMHAIGNGSFLIYSVGPDLGPIYGPDYTSASFGSLKIELSEAEQMTTRRLPGSNCWVHTLRRGEKTLEFTDVMDPERNVFVRRVKAEFACALRYEPNPAVRSFERSDLDCMFHILPPGTPCFTSDTTRKERRMAVFAGGCITQSHDGREISIVPGEGALTLAVSCVPELQETLCAVRDTEDIQARDRVFWEKFLEQGRAMRKAIPADSPEYERIQAELEAVPIQIKAQQSVSGGVMAGHFYPMAYVRDQAGVLRGMLRMGYREEAKAILSFWHAKWRRFGNLFNAEAMGNEEARLMFSNDEVEVPAYVIFCACEYLDVTGDAAFVESLFDMLSWAMTVQLKHLAYGMTGFSGDETYIAGGIFPRHYLYHGSAESTLLFLEGARRMLTYEKERGLLQPEERAAIAEGAEEAAQLYRENFVVDGVLYGNNPAREQYALPPQFHFGYCDADLLAGRPAPLTWLERSDNGLYCCPRCLAEKNLPSRNPEARILLGSVNLLPAYYHTSLFSRDELAINARPYMETFERTGYIRSELNAERSLGYDFGLLLYNAAHLNSELTERALRMTLDMADSCGMWAEYYVDGRPDNCRCRPWESAINMEAILYAVGADR